MEEEHSDYKDKAILSIVFLIIGIITFSWTIFSLIFGILALIYGFKAKKKGVKLGSIGFVLAIIWVGFILIYVLVFLYIPGPFVVHASSSMAHPGGYDNWWSEQGTWYEENNITNQQFKTFALSNGVGKADLIFVWKVNTENIEVGEIILYDAGQRYPVIHRVVERYEENNEIYYSTKGDNNHGQLSFERRILEEQVRGKAIFRIPKGGWFKLLVNDILKQVF